MTSTYPAEIATPVSPGRGPALREAGILLAGLIGALALEAGGGVPGVISRVATWGILMLVPGWALYRITARKAPDAVEGSLSALALSPVILATAGVLGLLAGATPFAVGRAVAGVFVIVGIVAAVRSGRAPVAVPSRRTVVAVSLLFTVLAVLTAWMPMTHEWWRARSDAWFHAAVVAQIRHYGVPPADPYFVGMPLQYMWFYHVMVLELADAMRLSAFWVMALVNVQALAALTVAAYHLASVFHRRLAHRFAATAALLLCFNAAFWMFLPVKLARAVIGDVRGMAEIRRTFTLTPFNYDTASGFLSIYFNQEFFLDKYMVATAFGLALAFMTLAWSAAASYLATGRRAALLLLAGAFVGMLGFHSLVGFVMLVAVFGGGILSHVFRRRIDGYRLRDVVVVLAVSLGCFIAMTPYLYEVMHLKTHEQVFPVSVSFAKIASIFISCAFVLVMAWRWRPLRTDRSMALRFFLFAALAVTAFCLSIRLPGPNTYDKLGYFVFVPFSVPAGFAVADSVLSRSGARRRFAAAAWVLLFFVPVNAIAIASSFATDGVVVTPAEEGLSAWVRQHTSRDAVFIDTDDHHPLLVTGPRRYLFGQWSYAWQWGYPRPEMSRRFHARRALYEPGPLDRTALGVLAHVDAPLYVVVRPGEHAAGATVLRRSDLFTRVYDEDDLALYRVDRNACRDAMNAAPPGPSPEELIRESGF